MHDGLPQHTKATLVQEEGKEQAKRFLENLYITCVMFNRRTPSYVSLLYDQIADLQILL